MFNLILKIAKKLKSPEEPTRSNEPEALEPACSNEPEALEPACSIEPDDVEPTCFNELVGAVLREQRLSSGLSQRETELAAGRDEGELAKIEDGSVEISYNIFNLYCAAFNIEPEELKKYITHLEYGYYKSQSYYNYEPYKISILEQDGKPKKKPKSRVQQRIYAREEIDPIDQAISERIRKYRLEANMTTTELSEALGITELSFNKIESGRNRITSSMLARTARILGVDISRFFEGIDPS